MLVSTSVLVASQWRLAYVATLAALLGAGGNLHPPLLLAHFFFNGMFLEFALGVVAYTSLRQRPSGLLAAACLVVGTAQDGCARPF